LEYSLEMSELSIYFPEEKKYLEQVKSSIRIKKEWMEGFIAGVVITLLIVLLGRKRKN